MDDETKYLVIKGAIRMALEGAAPRVTLKVVGSLTPEVEKVSLRPLQKRRMEQQVALDDPVANSR